MRIGEEKKAVQTDGEEKGAQISFLFPSVRRSSTEGNRNARYISAGSKLGCGILTESGIMNDSWPAARRGAIRDVRT